MTHDLTVGAEVAFIRVEDDSELTAIEQVYGHIDALQLIWCDSQGAMPWDAAYRNPPTAQAFLGPVPSEWEMDGTDNDTTD